MSKENVLKIVGISGIVVGSGCLYFTGTSTSLIGTLVGAVFVLIGIVISFFKKA
jgi:hypothetical protein